MIIYNHKSILTYTLLFIFILTQSFNAIGQSENLYPKEVKEKIAQVEHNLAENIQIVNAKSKWTIQERMQYYKTIAVSIAVIKDYKIQWIKAYGWADNIEMRPATTSTLFQAASISKSLNAIGILKLVQNKKLNLFTDINEYLKNWKFPYDSISKGKKITTANLLSHTAGLTVHGFDGYKLSDTIPTIIEILDGKHPANSEAIRSEFEPGLKYKYSGGGTIISQLIIQDISGKKYEEYMKENVLDPIGMTNSFFNQPPKKDKRNILATGYNDGGKEINGKYRIHPEQAAGGLWTNPTDLAKYIIETQLALKGKSQKVLSREMTKLRLKPYIDSSAALGVFIENKKGTKYFHHGGSNEGFQSEYIGSLKDGNGAVIMINSDNRDIINEIINSVAYTYNWKNYYIPIIKNEIILPDKILNTLIGEYKAPNWTFHIVKKNDGIWLDNDISIKKIHFTDNYNFFITERKDDFKFLIDKDGKVNAFIISDGRTAKKTE
jgi:CubicO group peptidase (beta-lactamase class C family)